jgi:hypothetical protein
MTYAVFTPQGDPLYWTHAETETRAWLKFVPSHAHLTHDARRAIFAEAKASGYTVLQLNVLDLRHRHQRIERFTRSDQRRVGE